MDIDKRSLLNVVGSVKVYGTYPSRCCDHVDSIFASGCLVLHQHPVIGDHGYAINRLGAG